MERAAGMAEWRRVRAGSRGLRRNAELVDGGSDGARWGGGAGVWWGHLEEAAGLFKWASGSTYDGEFKDGNFNGRGDGKGLVLRPRHGGDDDVLMFLVP